MLEENGTFLIFADALGYHYLRDRDIRQAFDDVFETICPAETLLSYSAGIHATIWTSTYPKEHKVWLEWLLTDFDGSEIEIDHWQWRIASFRTFLLKRFRPKEFDYKYIPNHMKRLFEKRDFNFFKPYFHPTIPSIFNVFESSNIRYRFSYCQRLEEIPLREKELVDVISLPEFDALGHRQGPYSPVTKKRILKLLERVNIIRKQTDSTVVLFSDHGMYQIRKRFNILKKLQQADLILGKDYVVFLDSTMARFWTREADSKTSLVEFLAETDEGKVLLEQDLDQNKLPKDEKFGQLIFLVEPSCEIFPNFFHPVWAEYEKGSHGYSVNGSNSKGIFAVNASVKLPDAVSLLDIAPTVTGCLDLPKPPEWRGKSIGL